MMMAAAAHPSGHRQRRLPENGDPASPHALHRRPDGERRSELGLEIRPYALAYFS